MKTEMEKAEILQKLIDETAVIEFDDSCAEDLLTDECKELKRLYDADKKKFMDYADQLLESACKDAYAYRMVFLYLYKVCRKDASLVDKVFVFGKQALMYGMLDASIVKKLFLLLRKKKFFHQAKSIHDMILGLPEPKLYAHPDVVKYLRGREPELARRLKNACDDEKDTFLSDDEFKVLKSNLPDCYARIPENVQLELDNKCKEISIEELFGV